MTHPALGSSLFALGFADHRGVKKNLSGRFFRNKGESIMTRMTIFAAALALGTVTAALPAAAQDASATPELMKVDWYDVQLIKWVPGKGGRAHEIIEMFMKTDKELGLSGVMDFHMRTGPWDSIVALPMRGGIAELGWANNPEEKKWDEAFAKQVGGPEKAKAIYDEFNTLILRSERHVGHIDRD